MTVSPRSVQMAKTKTKAKKNIGFIQSIKDELKKVTWTSKEELQICTKVVLSSIFAFGFGIYLIDLFLRGVLLGLSNLVKIMGF